MAATVRDELRATLRRAGAAIGGVTIDLDPPDVQPRLTITVARLEDPGDATLDDAIDAVIGLTAVTDRRVAATWLQGWIAWWVAGSAVAAWLLEGRVAALAPGDLWIGWDGHDAQIAIGRGAWLVRADDRLAGRPAVVVASDDALRAALHDRLVTLLAPVIAAFAARRRVGVRQQWLQSADRIAAAAQAAGLAADREPWAVAAVGALLARPGSPLHLPTAHGRGRFDEPTLPEPAATWIRATCCLAWRAPTGGLCATCPIRPDAAPDGTAPDPRRRAAPG